MKKLSSIAISASIMLGMSGSASAWYQDTHKQIVIDAVEYMEAHPDTTNFNKLNAAATGAGYTIEQFADILGQSAYDVDDFEDTFYCGAVTGVCEQYPIYDLGSSLGHYTSWWHFQNHSRGTDEHGNDFGGYNYKLLTVWGTLDNLIATWLWGSHMDDGKKGMTGWFGLEKTQYDTFGKTESNYRIGSSSSKSMYDDFEHSPFQPIDNLGQYWYNQFWDQPTAQTLGFVLHTTDMLQPHHAYVTIDLQHSPWEEWVLDFYTEENLNEEALITEALNDFTPLSADDHEVQAIITEGGAFSYANGGIVLESTDHNDRVQVAKQMIPHSIAMVIHILNHAADRF